MKILYRQLEQPPELGLGFDVVALWFVEGFETFAGLLTMPLFAAIILNFN